LPTLGCLPLFPAFGIFGQRHSVDQVKKHFQRITSAAKKKILSSLSSTLLPPSLWSAIFALNKNSNQFPESNRILYNGTF